MNDAPGYSIFDGRGEFPFGTVEIGRCCLLFVWCWLAQKGKIKTRMSMQVFRILDFGAFGRRAGRANRADGARPSSVCSISATQCEHQPRKHLAILEAEINKTQHHDSSVDPAAIVVMI